MTIKARVSPENNHVALRVKDLERVADFYENLLGLERIRFMGDPARPRTIFFPGVQLVRAEEADPAVKGVFDHVGLSVDNIEEICANLAARGVEFETPLTERHFEEIGQGLRLPSFATPRATASSSSTGCNERVVSGQWSVVSGQWSGSSGQWSVVSGQWSVVSGQWFSKARNPRLPSPSRRGPG